MVVDERKAIMHIHNLRFCEISSYINVVQKTVFKQHKKKNLLKLTYPSLIIA